MKRPVRLKTAPQPTSAQEIHRRKIWAAAMIEIAGETTADLASLPQAEREHARLCAEVLLDVARELLSDAPVPTLWDLPRPWA